MSKKYLYDILKALMEGNDVNADKAFSNFANVKGKKIVNLTESLDVINQLSREQCIKLLTPDMADPMDFEDDDIEPEDTSHFDAESTEALRSAVELHYQQGNITNNDITSVLNGHDPALYDDGDVYGEKDVDDDMPLRQLSDEE